MIRFAIALTLIFSMGLHWTLLQTVAWTNMLISYSRNAPFAEAVAKTFDGKHPCAMCLKIREGRDQEERQQKEAPLIKMEKMPDLILGDQRPLLPFAPAKAPNAVPFVPHLRADFIERPHTPPPRLSHAVL